MNYNEIESTVAQARIGDMEAMLKLIEQFKPFIFKQASSFHIKNMDTYDLVQIGYIALIKAVEKYNLGKKSFSSYVYSAIKNNMKYTLRGTHKTNKDVSLNVVINSEESSGDEFISTLDSNFNLEDDFFKNERIKEVKKLLLELPENELELVIMCYYNEFSIKTYAEKKSIPYLSAIRLKNRILDKLRKELEKELE